MATIIGELTSSTGVHDRGLGALVTSAKLSAIMRWVSRNVSGPA